MLHACDHVWRERLSALPDVQEFGDLFLLALGSIFDEVTHDDWQGVSHHLHTGGVGARSSVAGNSLAGLLGLLYPLADDRVYNV